MKHYNITVKGRVQGVFYRQSACEMAGRLGLTGFVRNEKNGDVYLEAEGTSDLLGRLIEWCRKGPPRASVTEVNFSEGTLQNFSSFDIRR